MGIKDFDVYVQYFIKVDGLPAFPVRNIPTEPQSFRPSPSLIAHPGQIVLSRFFYFFLTKKIK